MFLLTALPQYELGLTFMYIASQLVLRATVKHLTKAVGRRGDSSHDQNKRQLLPSFCILLGAPCPQ